MRLFIAVDLSGGAKREIEKLLKKLQKKHWKVKWEIPDKLHITLAFLGEIRQIGQIRQIGDLLKSAAAKTQPLVISFKGLGVFPDYLFSKIIWLGLKGDLKSLAALQKEIQGRLIGSGFKLDTKPFVPHITLGRIKRDCRLKQRQEIGRQLKAMRELKFQSEWYVDRVTLYQSQCLPQGSVYKKLAEIKLA
jgi:2'-5' RNA ligase